MPPMPGSMAVPVRPGPAALQSPAGSNSSKPGSGSSGGGHTSGSFIVLPPGAQPPNPPPQVPFPPADLPSRPPQRRLSRLMTQKPLPELPPSPSGPLNGRPKPATPAQPPSSWAVHFRGFVKAVRWSKSNPQLNKPVLNDEKSRETSKNTGLSSEVSGRNSQQAADSLSPNEKATNRPRFIGSTSVSSLGKKSRLPTNVSAGVGGVFLVPHMPVNTPHEFRPPTPGWMYPVPVVPYEMDTVRTMAGHGSESSRQSVDGAFQGSVSPPRADLALRKSVSEIGHGSVTYAPMSPEVSQSSFEQLPHFPADSTDPSREYFPRTPAILEADASEPLPPPVPPKSRFSLKRALSFKRGTEHKSTSDIPSTINAVLLSGHRPSKSVDAGRSVLGITTATDEAGRRRLRRRSTYADNFSSGSPSGRRGRDPPKFMLSPDASESSILSVAPVKSQSPSLATFTSPSASNARRRLTKRRPSEKSKSLLPTTVEVDTPSLETTDPIASISFPPPLPFPSYSEQMPMFPMPATPGLPLSAPPTTGLRTPGGHSLAPADVKPRAASPSSIPLPPVPLQPFVQQLPTPSPSSSSYEVSTPSHIMPSTKVGGAPPSAMRALRPALPHRPSLERRASRRRWTLDLASEDIDETVLKEELERLRLLGEPTNNSELSNMDPGWTLARKVLLSSREVILTERTYLNQITRFMADASEDAGTPPLLVKHLPLLISASQAFCNRLVEDPSAWGVSAAFVTVEAILEQVFVDYCQVVGQIMLACQQQATPQKSPSSSHSRFPSMSRSRTSIANGANEFGKIFVPSSKSAEKVASDDREKHTSVSAWHGSDDSPSGPGSRGVPRTRSMPGKSSKGRRISLPAVSSSSSTSITLAPVPNHAGSNSSTHLSTTPGPSPTDKRAPGSLATGRARAITAADIAIAPPQRVTRYVMLYRDLLNGTPLTAPSRPLVQRALDGALRIAENCNRAQNFMNRDP